MSQALSNVFKLKDIINVKDPAFGAKGDGVTNDSAAIQAAINFATSTGTGQIVYFPPGIYKCDSLVVDGGSAVVDEEIHFRGKYIIFRGCGRASQLTPNNDANTILTLQNGTMSCEISSLYFKGSGTGHTGQYSSTIAIKNDGIMHLRVVHTSIQRFQKAFDLVGFGVGYYANNLIKCNIGWNVGGSNSDSVWFANDIYVVGGSNAAGMVFYGASMTNQNIIANVFTGYEPGISQFVPVANYGIQVFGLAGATMRNFNIIANSFFGFINTIKTNPTGSTLYNHWQLRGNEHNGDQASGSGGPPTQRYDLAGIDMEAAFMCTFDDTFSFIGGVALKLSANASQNCRGNIIKGHYHLIKNEAILLRGNGGVCSRNLIKDVYIQETWNTGSPGPGDAIKLEDAATNTIMGGIILQEGVSDSVVAIRETGTTDDTNIGGGIQMYTNSTTKIVRNATTFGFLGESNLTRRIYSAPPTNGTWVKGDQVWNVNPAAGGAPGWVCTASGTPGTWKAMANLAV